MRVSIAKDPRSAAVIYPYLNGVDALTGSQFDRFVIDFEQKDQLQAASYSAPFEWVKTHVLPDRERKAQEGKDKDGIVRPHHKAFLARWWQLSFGRPEMLKATGPLPRFLACSYVTKRPIFMFISTNIRPSNLIQVFAFSDDYSFGILQSQVHWHWFTTKCGKLKSDFRYSAESVFDTFPWPQFHPEGETKLAGGDIRRIAAVAEAAREVRKVRAQVLPGIKGGLRALYRTLELPGTSPLKDAHAALEDAVLNAYGFSEKNDILDQLLRLRAYPTSQG